MRPVWASFLSAVGIVSAHLAFGHEWTQLFPTGDPPPARGSQAFVYDPVRDQGLMFGGKACAPVGFNDVWSLSLADPPTWTLVSTTGTPPTPRMAPAGVYDPVRDRLVIFGGFDMSPDFGTRNDVWALSLSDSFPTWQKLSTAGEAPTPRMNATMIYDPIDDRLVVFGGRDDFNCAFGDTWAFSLETHTWEQLAAVGEQPGARIAPGIYDPIAHRMLIYGGINSATSDCGPLIQYTDVWQLSLSEHPAWSQIFPSNSPPAPIKLLSVYDPVDHAMWLFGGLTLCPDPLCPIVDDETFSLELDGEPAWVLVPTVGVPPSWGGVTWRIKGVYDSERSQILAIDPVSCSENQVWSLQLAEGTCTPNDKDGDGVSECDGDCDDTNGNIFPGAPEVCDGEDNQCDGDVGHPDVDEGFPLLGIPCIVGIGACETSGAIVCTADGLGTECSAVPGTPTPEICDGIDNDCNGTADFPDETTDQDADNVPLCADCDDTNPNCLTDCTDADGDAFCASVDCDDEDPGVLAVPTEVTDLTVERVPGAARLSWPSQGQSAGTATSYDVVTGKLGDLLASGDFTGASCLADGHANSPYDDVLGNPAPGECDYYLVRAENSCGTGGFGDSTQSPDPRDDLDAGSACP